MTEGAAPLRIYVLAEPSGIAAFAPDTPHNLGVLMAKRANASRNSHMWLHQVVGARDCAIQACTVENVGVATGRQAVRVVLVRPGIMQRRQGGDGTYDGFARLAWRRGQRLRFCQGHDYEGCENG